MKVRENFRIVRHGYQHGVAVFYVEEFKKRWFKYRWVRHQRCIGGDLFDFIYSDQFDSQEEAEEYIQEEIEWSKGETIVG